MTRRAPALVGVALAVLSALGGGAPVAAGDGDGSAPASASEPPLTFYLRYRDLLVRHRAARFRPGARSRERALERARRIAALARSEPADFVELVRRCSEAPGAFGAPDAAAPSAGIPAAAAGLVLARRSNLTEAFAGRVAALAPGEISQPIASDAGFHVIRREPHVERMASAILIAWQGAPRTGPDVTRTRSEAAALTSEVLTTLAAQPERFDELARERSDVADRESGPALGVVTAGLIEPAVWGALTRLDEGEVAGRAVETAGGFLILRRDPLRLALYEQLLVEAGAGRTMEEALSLAGELIEQARAGQSLGALAERTPATRRTLAGPIPQTGPQAEARLQRRIFSVKAGEVCAEPLLTDRGPLVLRRLR